MDRIALQSLSFQLRILQMCVCPGIYSWSEFFNSVRIYHVKEAVLTHSQLQFENVRLVALPRLSVSQIVCHYIINMVPLDVFP
jgi:hypothetical protein